MEILEKRIMEMLEEIQPYAEFDETTDLLEEEVLDSVSILVWVQEIEEAFDITIEMDEVNDKNFKSIRTVAQLIDRKQK